jgi:hypothetical protein
MKPADVQIEINYVQIEINYLKKVLAWINYLHRERQRRSACSFGWFVLKEKYCWLVCSERKVPLAGG